MVQDVWPSRTRRRRSRLAAKLRDPVPGRHAAGGDAEAAEPGRRRRARDRPAGRDRRGLSARRHVPPGPRPARDHQRPDLPQGPKTAPPRRRRVAPARCSSSVVKPTRVILKGGGKNYLLGYPEHLGKKPDDGDAEAATQRPMSELDPARPGRHVPEAAQLAAGGAGQEPDRRPGRPAAKGAAGSRRRAESVGARARRFRRAPDSRPSHPATLTVHSSQLPDPRSPMVSSYGDTATQPLILELLSRRNWFKPKQLEEIEEALQQGRGRHLAGSGPDPRRLHLRAGGRPDLRRGPVPARDLQQRGSRRDRQGSRRPPPREALHWIG